MTNGEYLINTIERVMGISFDKSVCLREGDNVMVIVFDGLWWKAEHKPTPRGTYECFHCGSQSVVWQSDFSFEDYGLEGEGIINVCHCTNCGAHIEYYISLEEDDENEREETI